MVYKRKVGNKKRWSVGASAKFGPVGGSVRFSTRNTKRSFASKVTNIIHKEETPMHKVISEAGQSSALQNTWYTLNPLGNITRGTAFNNRIGDEIHLEAIKAKFLLYNIPATSVLNNTLYCRLLLLKTPLQFLAASDAWGSGLGATQMFISTVTNAPTLGLIDPKLVTVLYDKLHKVSPNMPIAAGGTAQTIASSFDVFVPLKRKFVYQTATNYGKAYNYYWTFAMYTPGGSNGVTGVGNLYVSSDLIFKNGV